MGERAHQIVQTFARYSLQIIISVRMDKLYLSTLFHIVMILDFGKLWNRFLNEIEQ